MGFLNILALTLVSVFALGGAAPTTPQATSSDLAHRTPGSANIYPIDQGCTHWELAKGVPSCGGVEGWNIRAYCSDDHDYLWSNWLNIDNCVDVNATGFLEHNYNTGNLSAHCVECNKGVHDLKVPVPGEVWPIPSHLLCVCKGPSATDHFDAAATGIQINDFLSGLSRGQIWCTPSTQADFNAVPDGATVAANGCKKLKMTTDTIPTDPSTSTRRSGLTTQGNDNSIVKRASSMSPSELVAKKDLAVKEPPPALTSFTSSCNPIFQLTGEEPGPTWPLKRRIMWTQCVNGAGVVANTSLDIGLCFGTSEGRLAPRRGGNFNATCWNCGHDPMADNPTLICHCFNNEHPDVPGANITATRVTIEPTVQVLDGTLTCYDFVGTRGLTPPPDLNLLKDSSERAIQGHNVSARHNPSNPVSGRALALTNGTQSSPGGLFYDSCDHDKFGMHQPNPILQGFCQRTHVGDASHAPDKVSMWSHLDLDQCFALTTDGNIVRGSGLAKRCNDCWLEGSQLKCICWVRDGRLVQEMRSIDMNLHLQDRDGTLTCLDPNDNPISGTPGRLSMATGNKAVAMEDSVVVTRDTMATLGGYYNTCSKFAMRQPEPALYAYCQKSAGGGGLWTNIDLSNCFAYEGGKIVPGSDLYQKGCANCSVAGSILQCTCQPSQASLPVQASIDMGPHISNMNGRLCCQNDQMCGSASENPPL